MERLKVAIADRILEISSENPENIKQKLNKIQRFSDFAEACKTLMTKYPEIETELLEMVRDDDFDASRASRRVDSIINREQKMSDPISGYQGNQIPEVIPIITPPPVDSNENDIVETQEITVFEETIEELEDQLSIEESSVSEEVPVPEDEFEPDAVLEEPPVFEEITEPEKEVIFSTMSEETEEDIDGKAKRKKQLTLLWQVLAIAVAIFVVVIVVKFVVDFWKPILIVLASLLAIYLLWFFLRKSNKNKIN